MQSRITFVVLFMLAFTVAHDTVINIMHTNEHTSSSHYVDKDIQSQECDSIDEMHGMFHFVALMTPYKNNFIQFPTEKTLSQYTLQYTALHKEPSYKPPTV